MNVALLRSAAGLILVVGLAVLPPAIGWPAERERSQLEINDLRQRGEALRAALDQTYRELHGAEKLSGGGTDITASVSPYFPDGVTFSDAETILRYAGLTLEPHPDLSRAADPNRTKDWYGVLAYLSWFNTWSLTRIDIYILLLPKTPGDYTTVAKVSAKLFASMP